jgi:hypothetical protein
MKFCLATTVFGLLFVHKIESLPTLFIQPQLAQAQHVFGGKWYKNTECAVGKFRQDAAGVGFELTATYAYVFKIYHKVDV